uniref:Uncharacterized protein n=1 Tax=Periophthalmus magnuspinnatus TaxID=409849 RepID=A0A3B4AGV5_9GOBI
MSLKQGIGSAEYLVKRVPKNVKYQHIKSKLDTGCSLTKYMEKVEYMKSNYRYKKDEIFKRLKVTTFAQLVIAVVFIPDALSVASEELESLTVRSNDSTSSPSAERQDARDIHTARSTLLRYENYSSVSRQVLHVSIEIEFEIVVS